VLVNFGISVIEALHIIFGKPTTKQVIPDDNVLFITRLVYQFIPIDGLDQERKLVYIIEKEDDIRVINHPKYKK
jgi:hypothetical protein